MTIPTVTVRSLESDINKSILRIHEIDSRSGRLFGAYLADSTLSLNTLFLVKPAQLAPDTAAPWQVPSTKSRWKIMPFTLKIE